jgi:hypothetical protein
VPLKTATLNPSNWTVRLEAESESESGRAVRYLIEEKLESAEALEAGRFSSARIFKSTVRLRPQRDGDTRAPKHPCTSAPSMVLCPASRYDPRAGDPT